MQTEGVTQLRQVLLKVLYDLMLSGIITLELCHWQTTNPTSQCLAHLDRLELKEKGNGLQVTFAPTRQPALKNKHQQRETDALHQPDRPASCLRFFNIMKKYYKQIHTFVKKN